MQVLGALAISDFLIPVKQPIIKMEVFTGDFAPFGGASFGIAEFGVDSFSGGWFDVDALGADVGKVLEEITISLGGVKLKPTPIAGTWSTRAFNKKALFFPKHPTSLYASVFQVGRKVRLYTGIKKSGVNYYFLQMTGVMARPSYEGKTLEVSVSGLDYMQALADTKLKSPNTYWGSNVTKSTAAGVYRYAMPADCTGGYIAYWNGSPIYNGNDWTHDAVTNEFVFNADKTILLGANNLIIYYFQVQIPENIVADLLVAAGLYATRADALATMIYTATGITIDRVWFPYGNSALYSMGQLCERCNYRFYIRYDSVPVFEPLPAAKGVGAEDLSLDKGKHANYKYYEDTGEVYNRITIEGDDKDLPIWKQGAAPNKFTGEASDADSIKAIGEKTLPISNHLFQNQPAIDSSCAAYLALFKDRKQYFSIDLPGSPVPLEMWDTIRVQERISSGCGDGVSFGSAEFGIDHFGDDGIIIAHRGLVRDIKIEKFTNTIICQEVP